MADDPTYPSSVSGVPPDLTPATGLSPSVQAAVVVSEGNNDPEEDIDSFSHPSGLNSTALEITSDFRNPAREGAEADPITLLIPDLLQEGISGNRSRRGEYLVVMLLFMCSHSRTVLLEYTYLICCFSHFHTRTQFIMALSRTSYPLARPLPHKLVLPCCYLFTIDYLMLTYY
jgi:hypothetical protein